MLGIDRPVGSDGDDLSSGHLPCPGPLKGDIDAFADHLQNGAAARCVAAVNHALASVDAVRQARRHSPKDFHRQGLIAAVAPGAELRVVAAIAAVVMLTMRVVARADGRLLRHRRGVEAPGGEQDLQWQLAVTGLQQPIPVKVLVQPVRDALDLRRVDEVDLVQQQQVGTADATA